MPPDEATTAPAAPPAVADPAPAPEATPDPAASPETAPDASAPAEPPEAPTETDPATEEPPAPPADKMTQLKALIEEMGLEFDGAKVLVGERAQFRDDMRKAHNKLEKARQQALTEIGQLRQQHEADINWAVQLMEAKRAGDLDAVAKHLGNKDWEDFQKEAYERKTTPDYEERQQMKAEIQRLKDKEIRDAQELAERQRQAEQAEAQRQMRIRITAEMKQSKDPFVVAMSEDPGFVRAIYEIQAQHWDGRRTISADQAARVKGPNGISLREQMRSFQKMLNDGFAHEDSPPEPAAPVLPPPKAKPAPGKTGVVPRASAAEPSPPKPMSEMEFTKYAEQRLREAIEEERAETEKKKKASNASAQT